MGNDRARNTHADSVADDVNANTALDRTNGGPGPSRGT